MDPHVVLIEDRNGAGNESPGSHFASKDEKDHAMAGSRKNGGRDGAVEKTRGGKVKKSTFPPRLEIPQTRRIPTFPKPRRLREIN
jgi:hypothetical protein